MQSYNYNELILVGTRAASGHQPCRLIRIGLVDTLVSVQRAYICREQLLFYPKSVISNLYTENTPWKPRNML